MEFVTVTLLLCLCGLVLWLLSRRPKDLPPGPWQLPVIGSLFSIRGDVRLVSDELRRKYGDIYCVYALGKPVVFLTGYDVIKEVLVKNADFLARPQGFGYRFLSRGKGIAGSSGQIWKEQRKFALLALRDLGMGKSVLEDKILEESCVLLKAFSDKQGQPFDCSLLIHNAVSNIICSIVFGKRFEYTDKLFKEFLYAQNFVLANIRKVNIMYGIPFLKLLPGDLFNFKKIVGLHGLIEDKLIKPSIEEHIALGDDAPRDFISGYIKEMKLRQQEQPDTTMDYESLTKVIFELFLAGSETTWTALRWAIVYLLNCPDVQEKCFQQIKENIGLNRSPSMKDKTSLPYLEATMMEILRHGEIAPNTIPYTAIEDFRLREFVLPKGVRIFPMLHSVLKSQDIWGDPDIFRPERFLDDNGRLLMQEKFIPFSLGRRVCLGESLSRMELFLFLTTMIQRFKFVVDKEKPSMEGIVAGTHSPKAFTFKVISR